jgi:hypothetical protein
LVKFKVQLITYPKVRVEEDYQVIELKEQKDLKGVVKKDLKDLNLYPNL